VILFRRALPFLAACLALFLVGCSLLPAPLNSVPNTQPGPQAALPADLAAQRDAWLRLGPREYTWVIQYGCECGLNGEYTITVVDGQVTEIGWPPRAEAEIGELPVGTVDELYAKAAETIGEGGEVHATWGDGGLPTSITFDPVPNAIDDELSVTVVSLTPSE
jgi:hypothetical protein